MADTEIQRFEVAPRGSLLGRGAFAVVNKAFDHQRGHEVAIKAVKLPDDVAMRRRLLREVQLLKGMEHRNIIVMYESFETPDMLHVVLELLLGITLQKLLLFRGALREWEVSGIASQLGPTARSMRRTRRTRARRSS